jgi:broad specificity phosphatase PhoE
VVKAWIEGRYAEFKGESWAAFNARVQAACQALAGEANGGQAAVFTSATPVSILVAATLGSRNPVDVMKLAGAAINSNFTVLHWRGGEAHLVMFNAIPHLADPALRTFR